MSYEDIYEEIDDLVEIIKDFNTKINSLSCIPAIVLAQVELDSDEYDAYGPEAIRVVTPYLGSGPIWVKPGPGNTYIPKKKEVVILQSSGTKSFDYVYWNMPFIHESHLLYHKDLEFDYGFVDDTVPFDYGGKRAKEATQNPGEHRIISSSKKYIIGARETEQELDISVDEGWRAGFFVGDGGSLYFGVRNPKLETEGVASGGSIDADVDLGLSGNLNLKSQSGNAELEFGSAATEKAALGETLKAKLETLIDHISAITVNTPLGPSSTPNNAADFTSLKSELAEILSTNFKHN